MTITKWNEKVSAMFDDASMYQADSLHYGNDADGAYFCTDGYRAFFLPGMEILTAKLYEKGNKGSVLPKIFHDASDNGKLAETVTSGKVDGKCARRFTLGDMEVFCYEKYLRVFPKNADFYISAPSAPILVSVWENGKANILGIVMPFRIMERRFSA